MAKSKALVKGDWRKELAKKAKGGSVRGREKSVDGNFISTKGGKFSIGGIIAGTEMDVIVLDYVFENAFYDTDFVDGEAGCPACFAIGFDEDELTPHPDSPKPQAKSCEDCELSKWDGDEKPECPNRRKIAVVAAPDANNPTIKILNIAPTSLKYWRGFIKQLDMQDLEPMQTVCHVEFDPESTQAVPPLLFDIGKEITNNKTLSALVGAIDEAQRLLEKPYDVSNYTGGKGKSKKKGSKKKGSKKKVVRKANKSKYA